MALLLPNLRQVLKYGASIKDRATRQAVTSLEGWSDELVRRLAQLEEGLTAVTMDDVTGLVAALAAKVASTRAINTTAPLSGGGDLSADRTLVVAANSTASAGVVSTAPNDTDKFWRGDASWANPFSGYDGFYGDSIDGTTSIAVNTTLTEDKMYENLTVALGAVLDPGGYRIFVADTLTLNGKIARNGNAAALSVAGAALAAGSMLGGQAGGNGATSGSGGAGGNGGASTAQPRGFVNGTAAQGNPGADGHLGGGAGGGIGGTTGGGTSTNGGAGGATGRQAAAGGTVLNLFQAVTMRSLSGTQFSGTSGGGGGGANSIAGMGQGGGGGGSGGIVFVAAKNITGGGAIEAKGGAGANAVAGGSGSRCGGGGGGAGGLIVVVTSGATFPTTDVTGGAGGTAGVGGGGGDGGDGGTGRVFQYRI